MFTGQDGPLAAGLGDGEDGVHHEPQIDFPRSATARRWRHVRLDHHPIAICGVACAAQSIAPILAARGLGQAMAAYGERAMGMTFRRKLADAQRRLVMEVTVIPSAVVTQAIAAAGADAVIIDLEHGAMGQEALHAMIAATAGSECAPLVRIPEMGAAHVKRALDMGAEGIVFPLVRNADDARACVASMRYPLAGVRGWGPFVAHSRWQVPLMEYLPTMASQVVCCLLLETADAVRNIDEICTVEGIDCAIVAQFDLSTTLGLPGQFDHPEFRAAVERIERAAFKAGIPLGAGPARSRQEAAALFARGYRMLANFDVLRLKGSVAETVGWTRDDQR